MGHGNRGAKWLAIIAVWLIMVVLGILVGPAGLKLPEIWSGLLPTGGDSMVGDILWGIRVPRLLVAGLCGGLLAAAGVLCQGLFRNPLASPAILGTSSGATALVALGFFGGISQAAWWVVPSLAVLGALASTLLVLGLVAWRRELRLEHLLLTGFALSALLSALATLLIALSLADYQKVQAMFYWLLGGFNGSQWPHVWLLLPVSVLSLVVALRCAGRLDVLNLGEEVAQTVGVDTLKLRQWVVVVVAVMVGVSVAVGGGIGFVGLVVPHVTRLLFGAEHRGLVVASAINGSSLLIGADLVAKTIVAPAELQVGVLTALLGAPFFIWLLLRPAANGDGR